MIDKVPVTVFTGFLGSGKTTIILDLIKQLPGSYRSVWLKNEYGDMAIDSELAKENNIAVKEMVNGCLCCVLVGRLGNALEEIMEKYNPERIFIETSGSAYPGPIALEIRHMGDKLSLDGLINVIDAVNFPGYSDKSYSARLSTQFTDLILINKHELVSEHQLDKAMDDVYELNDTTPKVKTNHGRVEKDLIFGLDGMLGLTPTKESHEPHEDYDFLEIKTDQVIDLERIKILLNKLPRDDFFRIKGVIKTEDGAFMLNYVFGRFDFQPLKEYRGETKILFIGQELSGHKACICQTLGISETELV